MLLSFILAICLYGNPCAQPSDDPDDPPREVVITTTTPSQGVPERSASHACRAFYYYQDSALEVFCNGIGTATLNLYDETDTVVDSVSITSDGRTSVWLSVPSAPGVYRLTITSASYCGEGYVWTL